VSWGRHPPLRNRPSLTFLSGWPLPVPKVDNPSQASARQRVPLPNAKNTPVCEHLFLTDRKGITSVSFWGGGPPKYSVPSHSVAGVSGSTRLEGLFFFTMERVFQGERGPEKFLFFFPLRQGSGSPHSPNKNKQRIGGRTTGSDYQQSFRFYP